MLTLEEIKKLLLVKKEGKYGAVILLTICMVVLISSLLFGYDPLNFGTFNSTEMYRIESENIIKMNLKKEQKEYTSKELSLNGQDELNKSLAKQKIIFEGKGKVSEIRELKYNYEVVMNYHVNLGKSREIYLRIPYGKQDDFIKNLIVHEKIKFKGFFHYFQNTGTEYRTILQNCEIIK